MKTSSKFFPLFSVALIFVSTGCNSSSTSQLVKSEAVGEEYLKAVKNGNYDRAAQVCLALSINAQTIKADWQKQEKKHGKLVSWRIGAANADTEGTTDINYKIQFSKDAAEAWITVSNKLDGYSISSFKFVEK